MLVRRDALRRALGHVHQASQDAPRVVLVAVRAAPGVPEGALPVEGAVASAPAPGHLHVGLVQGPGVAGAAPTLRAAPRSDARRDAARPGPDRLGGDGAAPFEPHRSDVAAAARIAQPPEHGEPHDVRRGLPVI